MRTVHIYLLVTVLFLIATATHAQQTTGSLEGVVHDEAGPVLPGATLTAHSPHLQGGRTVKVGPQGRFVLAALPVGLYTITVEYPGYRTLTLKDIRVGLGTVTNLGNVVLQGAIAVVDTMIVTGAAPLIDPVSTTVGANMRSEEYFDLPLDRSYRNMSMLLPHIQQSYLGDGINVGGGTGYENKYYIDGVDATDPTVGMASTDLPYNFIREVRVRSGGYEAEYRGSLGGVMDVITLSGTNDFRGQAFGFYTNDQLMGEPRQSAEDPSTGKLTMYDLGFSVGGPITEDKLWYQVAYNPAFTSEEFALAGTGTYEDETTTHRAAAKLNWRVNDYNDLEFSFFADPTTSEGAGSLPTFLGTPSDLENPDPALRDAKAGGYNAVLSGKHWLGGSFLLESKLSLVDREQSSLPMTTRGAEEALYIDGFTGAWSGGKPWNVDNQTRTGSAGVAGSWFTGDHSLKAGVEYRHQTLDSFEDVDIIMSFDSGGGVPGYFQLEYNVLGTVKNRLLSAYLQDSWRLADSFRLNLGMRWDGQSVIGSNDEVAQSFLDQWQPRVGFTFQPGDSGRGQLFGSAGRFYQDLALAAPAGLFIEGTLYRVTYYDHDPREDPTGGVIDVEDISQVGEEFDLEGQHFDELTLGYAHMVGDRAKFTLRGIYRELQNALEDAIVDEVEHRAEWGNPGYGELIAFPQVSRIYRALEITLEHAPADRYNFQLSYVLSENKGNFPGIYPSDIAIPGTPNLGPTFDLLEMTIDGHGLLPNDRRHVLKFQGSWRPVSNLSTGLTAFWMSGTPLNEFGAAMDNPGYRVFIQPRGTAGTTSDIWDINLRFAYTLPFWKGSNVEPRLILDWLHIASQREPVDYEQKSHFARDPDTGEHIQSNPTYGLPVAYQPPMAFRFGVEVGF